MQLLKQCISAEWLKLRHSHLWAVLLALPVVSALIGCANFSINRGALSHEWYSLWSQVGLFYAEFFLPTLIAICCAYLCRLEHLNKNWNTIMTAPVPASGIFAAKLAVAGMLMAGVQALMFVLYYIGGKVIGLVSPLPPELFGWLLRGWLAAVAICSLQLALSLRIRSFAAPVGIGLCAAFAGLGMYVLKAGLLFPHSLLTIGMGVLSQTSLSFRDQLLFCIMSLLYAAAFGGWAIYRLRTSDVTA
ncbi:ABC transporter permease [Paenibacillus hodogayensis]|uniref:ABC transporter permease n=1 Tax=Paenibacillus hodogayensis TaxID=279208 RepID=A0ABV5VS98_9BACL